VEHILDLGSHSLVIGRIEQTYVSDGCLTDGKPDLAKINTMVFTQKRQYLAFGPVVADAYTIGKELMSGE
jgi:flavin reductase (DIM6/NTAB) family NADH-FMN oxidoreductase RutF